MTSESFGLVPVTFGGTAARAMGGVSAMATFGDTIRGLVQNGIETNSKLY